MAPDPLAAFDDELADVSVIDQHTTSPAAPSTEDLEAAPCRSSAPANTAAASEAAATPPASPDLSEEAQADSTAAQIVTPFDLFASEELSSAHIADTQAAADSGQDLSHLTPQSSPVGASSSSVSERFPARYHERPEASLAAARSGLLPAQAEGTQGHKGIFEGLLASQSTSVEYAEASQQHPAAAEPDPVRLSGEQLSTTIEKLLEAYQPGTPLAAQVSETCPVPIVLVPIVENVRRCTKQLVGFFFLDCTRWSSMCCSHVERFADVSQWFACLPNRAMCN